MESNKKTGTEREMPNAHLIHILSAVVIMSILIFDGVVFNFSTRVLSFIPWWIRIIICGIVLFFALVFIIKSHRALFSKEKHGPSHVVTSGVFEQVRHPMYLGILLVHFAFILFMMSLIALAAWFVVIVIYDRLASYEEKVLEEIFGEEYHKYKERTSKFLPR